MAGFHDQLKALRVGLRKPVRYFPKEPTVSLTIGSGSPTGFEALYTVSPLDGYYFNIRYFKLTTPLEVEGNLKPTGLDEVETFLLSANQGVDIPEKLYDASDWDADFFHLKKFAIYAITTTTTTADRTLTLAYSGGYGLSNPHSPSSNPSSYKRGFLFIKSPVKLPNPHPVKIILDRIKLDSPFGIYEPVEKIIPLFRKADGVYASYEPISFISYVKVILNVLQS